MGTQQSLRERKAATVLGNSAQILCAALPQTRLYAEIVVVGAPRRQDGQISAA